MIGRGRDGKQVHLPSQNKVNKSELGKAPKIQENCVGRSDGARRSSGRGRGRHVVNSAGTSTSAAEPFQMAAADQISRLHKSAPFCG